MHAGRRVLTCNRIEYTLFDVCKCGDSIDSFGYDEGR
jgi:hypothetical protein